MPVYNCYGLTFESDIELPDYLLGDPDAVQAFIRRAEIEPMEMEGWYQIDGSKIYSNPVPGGFRAVIENAVATIDQYLPELSHAFPAFFPANCMAALVIESGLTPLHGNAISAASDKDGSFVILGGPKAGKSTTSARFSQLGYRLLSDDLSTIDLNSSDGRIRVHPGNPRLKLWKDSFPRLNQEQPSDLIPVPTVSGKYYVPMPRAEGDAPRILRQIFILHPVDDDSPVKIREIVGAEKLGALVEHVYRYRLHELLEGFPWILPALSTVANQVPIFQIERPVGGETLDEVVELIESKMVHDG